MEKSRPFPRFFVRNEYLKTMGINLVAGRDYDLSVQTDDSLALVVNEKFVEMMGWGSPEEAIGKRYYYRNKLKGRIVGVAANYNFVSKHHAIGPLVLDLNMRPSAFNLFLKYMVVRTDGDRTQEALANLEATWKAIMPNRPFDYFFLDDRLADSYKSERKLSAVTIVFSFLAILVACLGLFGLATFSVEQRIKEIGVRKVLGIKTIQILHLLSKEFVYLILIAFVIATPITYLLLEAWLNNFAYRISISLWPFLFAGVVTLVVSFLTVLYHAIKASLINPVETLKCE
jgi:putative ABC transport system permease protein